MGYTLRRTNVEARDYEGLIRRLDGEILEARKNFDAQRRREDLERRVRMLREQIDGLQTRRTSLVQIGLQPRVDEIDPILGQMQKEMADVRAAMLSLGPSTGGEEALKLALGSPRPELGGTHAVDGAARTEAMTLIDEVEAGKSMIADWAQEERGAQVRLWALRWRTLAERIGQGVARGDAVMRKAYAVIMETRERYPGLPFIEALDPRRRGDWAAELEVAKRDLPAIREKAKKDRAAKS